MAFLGGFQVLFWLLHFGVHSLCTPPYITSTSQSFDLTLYRDLLRFHSSADEQIFQRTVISLHLTSVLLYYLLL